MAMWILRLDHSSYTDNFLGKRDARLIQCRFMMKYELLLSQYILQDLCDGIGAEPLADLLPLADSHLSELVDRIGASFPVLEELQYSIVIIHTLADVLFLERPKRISAYL